MLLNSALLLLVCLFTGSVLIAVIKVLDRLVGPFQKQLQPPKGSQDHPIGHHLNPVDATLITSEPYEAAAERLEGAGEGLATVIESGIETLSGMAEHLPS